MENDLIHSGLISYMDENYKTAVDQFTKSIEKNCENFEALVYRGCSNIKLGNFSSAITDFDMANKFKENNFEVLYNRSKAHFMNMDFAKGHADLAKLQALSDLSEEQKNTVYLLASKFSSNI